jgi:hypothetical protein
MGCISVYMKEYQGIGGRIAAVSPCVVKSNEFGETKLVDYNVTFAKMLAYLAENDIALPDEETDFDCDESGLGSLFPAPGGLKENIEYFTGKKLHITAAEGFGVYEKLNEYAETPEGFLPDIFDVLSCEEGCNMGSAYARERKIFEIEKTMDSGRKKAFSERKRELYESVFKKYDGALDITRFLREYRPVDTPFPHIDGNASHRAVHRVKPFQQIVPVHFAIFDDDRAGLGYYGRTVFFKAPDMRPYADIGPERNVVYLAYAEPLQICEQPFVSGYVRPDRGRGYQRYGDAFRKVVKEPAGIVRKKPCLMFTRGHAPAAGYAFIVVNFDFNIAGFILICNIGRFHRTFPDAFITSGA